MAKCEEKDPTAFAIIVTIPVLAMIIAAISQPLPHKKEASVRQAGKQESISDIIAEFDEIQPVVLHYIIKANNNPGNLRGKDGEFRNFATPLAGLKAMYEDIFAKVTGSSKIMTAKFGRNYDCTLRNLITAWAPPHENDTENYIAFVAKDSGLNPDKVLNVADIQLFIFSMVRMENGSAVAEEYLQLASN